MKQTCNAYRKPAHKDSKKKKDNMQITLTKEQMKELFGELRYMGADCYYRYDRENRK